MATIDAAIEASAGAAAADPANSRRLTINFFCFPPVSSRRNCSRSAAFSYLARILSAPDYGALEFTLAVMVFFTLPVDLGLGLVWRRRDCQESCRRPAPFARDHRYAALLAVCSFVVLALSVLLAAKEAPP